MKHIILNLIIFAVFSPLAFAHNHGGRIEARKANIEAHLDKKIEQLNAHKSCISAASAKGDIKKCMSSHKEKMKSLKAEMKSNRQSLKAKFKASKKKS